ncbi:MAG: helix-turn-helix transcriptional regulator [Christensenellales bacterium]|jgi:hypothetical protein
MMLEDAPLLLSAQDMMKLTKLGRSMVYRLLNDSSFPVIQIGRRKFMHRDRFLQRLEEQAERGVKL